MSNDALLKLRADWTKPSTVGLMNSKRSAVPGLMVREAAREGLALVRCRGERYQSNFETDRATPGQAGARCLFGYETK